MQAGKNHKECTVLSEKASHILKKLQRLVHQLQCLKMSVNLHTSQSKVQKPHRVLQNTCKNVNKIWTSVVTYGMNRLIENEINS